MVENVHDSDAVLHRFNKLMQELLRGDLRRNTFLPWEVGILLDLEACSVKEPVGRETLKRYQKAVQRDIDRGATVPLMLSEYLERSRLRREDGQSRSETPAPARG